ncbi:pyrroloquinoline quinone biosynthesis peptide chaperone PqqD [Salinicola endophyticus]|uniref:Pyrroloquinoline quinone biosynthesis peptide chaperone PqqD n=1 Tax=Salinicola endophyticus TaxID=1949083 RepID=A0ABY8FHY5_9GAMM|nr:pyrroloquinoline quinone biosynthesis peptide chaperone PqqD [Salinicola endophyticus]WFF41670.1 pyrroloquinoline quinone biosynthesis peptide chaperone PqqD [Salinicola endophyticus]
MNPSAPALAEEAIVRLPRGVRLREDKARGGWVLLAPERVFQLDPVAREVLARVDGERDIGAIVDDLAVAFAAPRERILGDVRAMLADLILKQVLEVA